MVTELWFLSPQPQCLAIETWFLATEDVILEIHNPGGAKIPPHVVKSGSLNPAVKGLQSPGGPTAAAATEVAPAAAGLGSG